MGESQAKLKMAINAFTLGEDIMIRTNVTELILWPFFKANLSEVWPFLTLVEVYFEGWFERNIFLLNFVHGYLLPWKSKRS